MLLLCSEDVIIHNDEKINIKERLLQKFMLIVFIITAQKMKFSIKDFFSKCDQIRSFLRIWSHILKKSLIGNFIFCAVVLCGKHYDYLQYRMYDKGSYNTRRTFCPKDFFRSLIKDIQLLYIDLFGHFNRWRQQYLKNVCLSMFLIFDTKLYSLLCLVDPKILGASKNLFFLLFAIACLQ